MQKTNLHYLKQMWFYLHLANLILAWKSTKSAPLNGQYPKLQFLTYLYLVFSCSVTLWLQIGFALVGLAAVWHEAHWDPGFVSILNSLKLGTQLLPESLIVPPFGLVVTLWFTVLIENLFVCFFFQPLHLPTDVSESCFLNTDACVKMMTVLMM